MPEIKEDYHCIDWAINALISHGFIVKSQATLVTTAPWSTVWRFETESEFIYLKRSIQEFSIETKIIEIIDQIQPGFVPKVIAANHELNCFLMFDAGVTLRKQFKHQFDADLLAKLIKQYTTLQCVISEKTTTLLELGVPDWGLKKVPELYADLLENDVLLDEIGILSHETEKLIDMKPKIAEMCERLSSYKIPDTLDHCDFHDNNVLYDSANHHLTLIDLGEMVISHPFFPLHSLFFMQQYWNYFKKDDQNYIKIKDACLSNFRQFESDQHLSQIFDLTLLLHPLYYVFSIMRLITACDKEGFKTEFTDPDGIVKSLKAQKNNIAGCLREIMDMGNPL